MFSLNGLLPEASNDEHRSATLVGRADIEEAIRR
jgi:hypothetical protein